MAEVAALFKQFLYRDLAFILGGSIVLLSLAYALRGLPGFPAIDWQKIDWEKFPPASTVLIFAATAFVIGYAVQDLGGVLRLTPTGRFQPGCFRKWLYKRFTGVSWQAINYVVPTSDREFKFEIHLGRLDIPEHVIQELGRIRSLKVISMCVGACLLLSALIFFVQLFFHSSVAIDLVTCIVFFLLAVGLICLGWIKGMQEMQFYQSIHEEFPEKQTGTIKWGATLFTINKG